MPTRELAMPTGELGTTAARPSRGSPGALGHQPAAPCARPASRDRARARGPRRAHSGWSWMGLGPTRRCAARCPRTIRGHPAPAAPVDTVADLAVTAGSDARCGANPSTVPMDEVWISRLAGVGHRRG
ncbi:hypothetical protein FRAAL0028 [Frankia alni ACN14a]|uniref:Uncharacterized protein n=1 Tax=Frankia alni (strain DSM 45986 / CECT 9034 / ACN14a) TaxID=326424 RepID=Q0RUM8_FRAAA|nr:hypothetical protein FRAAL0028 [Frankia alni ACN14a]